MSLHDEGFTQSGGDEHRAFTALLVRERERLLNLLASLKPGEWDLPTECPAWSVKGIALHLLADDLSLLSRQRDRAEPGVYVQVHGQDWVELMRDFDLFNERWVAAASFLSTELIAELLRVSEGWTATWYRGVDPVQIGEPIHWIGPDPAPYWLLAGREYLERWIHHWQISRATSRAGPDEIDYVAPAVEMTLRGYPRGLAALPAEQGTSMAITLVDGDASWTLLKSSDQWIIRRHTPPEPTASIAIEVKDAAMVFSRGVRRDDIAPMFCMGGDADLSHAFVAGTAAVFGRD